MQFWEGLATEVNYMKEEQTEGKGTKNNMKKGRGGRKVEGR